MTQGLKLRRGDRLVLATHNAGKLAELQELLKPFGLDLTSAGELGLPEPEETGTTFAENARIKAHATAKASGILSLADDSGLSVDAIGGKPGVYTANWALVWGDKAVLSALPNVRQPETPYAEKALARLGKQIIHPPEGVRFSGQGDALPCGDLLFCGSQYRTDPEIYDFLEKQLGFEVIGLQTVPTYDSQGAPVINKSSGWPDSFFYDIDLALAVISPELIAWCPEAFTDESRDRIQKLRLDKIEVTLDEAMNGFACNLVSTGHAVVMSAHAPLLKSALEVRGFEVITPEVSELGKGGGYIRCTTLTLDNA